jgi:hypothetical protein
MTSTPGRSIEMRWLVALNATRDLARPAAERTRQRGIVRTKHVRRKRLPQVLERGQTRSAAFDVGGHGFLFRTLQSADGKRQKLVCGRATTHDYFLPLAWRAGAGATRVRGSSGGSCSGFHSAALPTQMIAGVCHDGAPRTGLWEHTDQVRPTRHSKQAKLVMGHGGKC